MYFHCLSALSNKGGVGFRCLSALPSKGAGVLAFSVARVQPACMTPLDAAAQQSHSSHYAVRTALPQLQLQLCGRLLLLSIFQQTTSWTSAGAMMFPCPLETACAPAASTVGACGLA